MELLEPRTVLATFTVASAADNGPQTLRDAIQRANATPGADVIQFAIPVTARQPVITLAAPLPAVTDSVSIDARSQPGVSLDGTRLSTSATGLQFARTATESEVLGLKVTGFRGTGIVAAANGFRLAGSRLSNNGTALSLAAVANGRIGSAGNGNTFGTNTHGLTATGNCSGTVVSANTFTNNGVGTSLDSATGITVGGEEKTLSSYAFASLATLNDAGEMDPGVGSLTVDAAGNVYGMTRRGDVFRIANDAARTRTTLASLRQECPAGSLTLDAAGNIYGATLSSVFKIANDRARTLTTLATFGGKNGSSLTGGLTLDAAGTIYGTAQSGGAGGYGTVFKLSQTGTPGVTVLASFNLSNGAWPNGNLALDAAGNIFGTTQGGGAKALGGTVFKVANDSARTLTTLVTFTGPNGAQPVGGLVADSAGNLYGATGRGGQPGNLIGGGTVFKLANDAARTFTTLAVLTGAAGGPWVPSGGVAVDASGNLYGTSTFGGWAGYGCVFKVSGDASRTVTTICSFNRGGTGDSPTNGVAIDSYGNIFGTTTARPITGSSLSYIYQLSPLAASNVYVRNCFGIRATGGLDGTRIQANAISESLFCGVLLQNATGVLVGGRTGLGNSVSGGTSLEPRVSSSSAAGSGLCVQGGSARSIVQGNLFNGNVGNGMALVQATGLTLTANMSSSNGGLGLSYTTLAGITVSGNLLSRNGPRGDFRF
jgi:hypothetical protein